MTFEMLKDSRIEFVCFSFCVGLLFLSTFRYSLLLLLLILVVMIMQT